MMSVSAREISRGKGILLAFVCLSILGAMPVIANSRPIDFDAHSFALFLSAWQVLFALPLFLGELRSRDRGIFAADLAPQAQRRTLLIILGTGAIFGLSTYVYVLAVEKAGAVGAAIAIQAYPLFAILWETLFLKRRKTAAELGLTCVLIATMVFLLTKGTWRVDAISLWFGFALLIPFLWSIAHVVIKEVLDATPITPAQVTLFRVVTSTVVLAVALVALADTDRLWATAVSIDLQKFAVLMGLVYYLELICWFSAVRHIPVSLASSITVPAPALTMVLAILVLGDRVAPYQVGAIGVVMATIYGLLLAGRRRAVPA